MHARTHGSSSRLASPPRRRRGSGGTAGARRRATPGCGHCPTAHPGHGRAPERVRRGRGRQPVDPRGDALRPVLLPAGPDVLRQDRRVRRRRPGPPDARRVDRAERRLHASGRSRSATGITFTDGTPLDAAAVIYNLQAAGTGVLVSAALQGHRQGPRPRRPRADDPQDRADRRHVVHRSSPARTATPTSRSRGATSPPSSPASGGSSHRRPGSRRSPRTRSWRPNRSGTGPFIVDSYEPRGSLEVSRNPDYWMTDAAGNQLPVPRLDHVPGDRGLRRPRSRRCSPGTSTWSRRRTAGRSPTIQNPGDEFTRQPAGRARRDRTT